MTYRRTPEDFGIRVGSLRAIVTFMAGAALIILAAGVVAVVVSAAGIGDLADGILDVGVPVAVLIGYILIVRRW